DLALVAEAHELVDGGIGVRRHFSQPVELKDVDVVRAELSQAALGGATHAAAQEAKRWSRRYDHVLAVLVQGLNHRAPDLARPHFRPEDVVDAAFEGGASAARVDAVVACEAETVRGLI